MITTFLKVDCGCCAYRHIHSTRCGLQDQVLMVQYRGKIKMLLALTLLGIAYSILLYYQGTLTGRDNVDGIIGVVFGLYMCSYPAAFIVDLLFFRRDSWHKFSSSRSTLIWLALNMLVLLIGWLVIFLGTTRLIGRTEGVSLWG